MESYTINNLLGESALAGLRLLTGEENAGNEISNVNIIDNPDSYDWLSAGDLLLTTGFIFKDDETMQRRLIRELSEINCAGLAVKTRRYLSSIPEAMLDEARARNFPLIEIPVHYPLSHLCKVVLGRLSHDEKDKASQFVPLYHAITRGIMEENGLSKVMNTLSDFVGNTVLLLDEKWQLLVYSALPEDSLPIERVLLMEPGRRIFSRELELDVPEEFSSFSRPIKRTIDCPGGPAVCRILPIATDHAVYGYLVVWETENKMQTIEYSALEIASTAIIMERVKARQIEEIRQHIKQDFFDYLLEGKIDSVDTVNSMAGVHNLDPDGTYVCALIKGMFPLAEQTDFERLHDVSLLLKDKVLGAVGDCARRASRSCVSIHRGRFFIVFLKVAKEEARHALSDSVKQFFQTVYEVISEENPGYPFHLGVGEPRAGLIHVHHSFVEAQEAVRISINMGRIPGVYFYEDCLVYKLLDTVAATDLAREFCRMTVEPLAAFDRENNTNMLETLEQYFACNCNVSQTAKKLYVHRNTLIYRIDKIKDILNRELKDSEELLCLQIGLKIRQLRKYRREDGSD